MESTSEKTPLSTPDPIEKLMDDMTHMIGTPEERLRCVAACLYASGWRVVHGVLMNSYHAPTDRDGRIPQPTAFQLSSVIEATFCGLPILAPDTTQIACVSCSHAHTFAGRPDAEAMAEVLEAEGWEFRGDWVCPKCKERAT